MDNEILTYRMFNLLVSTRTTRSTGYRATLESGLERGERLFDYAVS
jgi:hypothetical protein